MKFKIIYCLLLLTVCVPLKAQNLVINPSFEDTIKRNYTTYYSICKNWYNANGMTSDYFSPYAIQLGWGYAFDAPHTFAGFQYAQDGIAFIGLVVWEPKNHVTKDYIQGFLSEPLIAGKIYNVSLFIKMADSSMYRSCEIDISFSDTLIYSSSGGPFDFSDTVKFDITNADTSNWIFLSKNYIAKGGEKYLYIGSNEPNQSINCIDTFPYGKNIQAAYYFIDNLNISDATDIKPIISVGKINVYPNPLRNVINVFNLQKESLATIYDVYGHKIMNIILNPPNDAIYVRNFSNGIYFLNLNEKEFYKIIITH